MPLQMSTRCRYGVRLMIALAEGYGNGISLRDIASSEGISEKYLGQIIVSLKTAGLVTARRGSHGGYALAKLPASISIKDIVEAIDGPILPVPCVEDKKVCDRIGSCVATHVWTKLRDEMVRTLESFDLASLASEARELRSPGGDYVI